MLACERMMGGGVAHAAKLQQVPKWVFLQTNCNCNKEFVQLGQTSSLVANEYHSLVTELERSKMKFNANKNRLLIATAIGFAVIMPSTAVAQEETDTASETQASEDGEFLGELTLGQSKREVQTGTATPLTTIKQEEIDDRQANTIAELIDSVPGVTLVNGQTPQGSGINIRGFGANSIYGTDQKVAVLVDGATTGAEEIYRVSNQLFTDP